MAQTITPITIFALTPVTAGGTKTAPHATGLGASVANPSNRISPLSWHVKNASPAPFAPGVMTIQHTTDGGTTWNDFHTVAGDTTANSDNSGTIDCPNGITDLRAICYGNTTNPVSFSLILSSVVVS